MESEEAELGHNMSEPDDGDSPREAAETDTAFAFEVPVGLKAGVTMKVQAPDGVYLHIPMPPSVLPGDELHMKKLETGKWAIDHVVRVSQPEVTAEGEVALRGSAQLAADLNEKNVCSVVLETSKGPIRLRVVPSWAPLGAQRFLLLVVNKYYTDIAIYRAVPGFLVQFGVLCDDQRTSRYEPIKDDAVRGVPIVPGSVCFAASGANTRTATMCIFLNEFAELGKNSWETPVGQVCEESMDVLYSIFTGYGDMPQAGGSGPDPARLLEFGNEYIREEFPECDFVYSAAWEAA